MKLRIGIVGLGSIAQKVYLPLLCQSGDWQVIGAFSPNQQKARALGESYRIECFNSVESLADQCDAVFVHASTAMHFSLVSLLLERGVHVYVDKPLAETLEQAERLVSLAERRNKALMVGFNRRFAPRYLELKQDMVAPASVRMDKHRAADIGPHDLRFTLLDDYLHVVDTALWLVDGEPRLSGGALQTNQAGQMIYAEHHFQVGDCLVTTSMHRQAGSQCETISAVTEGAIWHIDDMRQLRKAAAGIISERPVPAWQTILAQRGFTGAVDHFLNSVANQTPPSVSGEEALKAQAWIERLLR
ncbi:Gfo/Idh/MocA family protein [Biostraticola tofi]|uniref:Virulence factor n=1 Tax=Biostraticola tofi TaxID=466109 RepID=A0A4R3Z7L9_9GAMM|nr:Gfo/Idh/MocA family oxidoreductase [Biostraticola tofi]TCW00050.1 virulence factor [Biostraticola tofi]